MVFSRTFPREVDGSNYPKWEEIFLSAQEEREREQVARQENLFLMRQCIADARNILKDEKMMDMQSHVLSLANSLFKKRSSHAVHYKEEKCKEKFQRYWGKFKQKKKEMKTETKADKKPAGKKKVKKK
ncbi:hypothetical protein KY349_06040 [Candidatus Woesearchaeota archaeon]|nr:hypothetical protein [Candidatus Woesearchaeota archaeon]